MGPALMRVARLNAKPPPARASGGSFKLRTGVLDPNYLHWNRVEGVPARG